MSFGKLGTMGRGFGAFGSIGAGGPSWVPSGATTVFDYENGQSYFNGTIDTLANDSLNYLVTSQSQTNVLPYAGDLRAGTIWPVPARSPPENTAANLTQQSNLTQPPSGRLFAAWSI